MRRAAAVIAVTMWSTVAGAQAPSASASVPALPELAARVTPSVVLVRILDDRGKEAGSGSGFFVSTDRIITNHHVIDGASGAKVALSDGREVAVTGVLADDEDNDLALLQVEGKDHPALSLGDATLVRVGDEVVVIGSPRGLSTTVSTGIIGAIRDQGLPAEQASFATKAWSLHITAPISPGSSGSPIFTRRGDVIGVVVGGATTGEGLNFGIRVEMARALMGRASEKPRPLGDHVSARDVLRNLGISAAVLGLFVGGWFFVNRQSSSSRAARRRA